MTSIFALSLAGKLDIHILQTKVFFIDNLNRAIRDNLIETEFRNRIRRKKIGKKEKSEK